MDMKCVVKPSFTQDLLHVLFKMDEAASENKCKLASELSATSVNHNVRVYEMPENTLHILICNELVRNVNFDEGGTYYQGNKTKCDIARKYCKKFGMPEIVIRLHPDDGEVFVHTANLSMYADSRSCGYANSAFNIDAVVADVGKVEAYAAFINYWSYIEGFIAGRTGLNVSDPLIAQHFWFLDEYGEIVVPKEEHEINEDDEPASDETYAIKA